MYKFIKKARIIPFTLLFYYNTDSNKPMIDQITIVNELHQNSIDYVDISLAYIKSFEISI